jgi:hypothetical protein
VALIETAPRTLLGTDHLPVYKKRFLRSLGVWTPEGWSIKCYMTSAFGDKLPPGFLAAGKQCIGPRLSEVDAPHKVGFMILSHGILGQWVMLDWWKGALLYENIFVTDEDPPRQFDAAPEGLFQCVWELRITQHEREAWIKHVLANPNGPDLDGYLSDQLNIDV